MTMCGNVNHFTKLQLNGYEHGTRRCEVIHDSRKSLSHDEGGTLSLMFVSFCYDIYNAVYNLYKEDMSFLAYQCFSIDKKNF